jgi:uncharacterized protein (DUF983 family)
LTRTAGADPFLAGLRGRCPNCGEGRLFSGFLRIERACAACGFDLAALESGDGPAVFVIIAVGFFAVFGLLVTDIRYSPPIWVLLVTWFPGSALLCLGLLRPMKGLMIAAQIRNQAAQHRRDQKP